MSLMIPIGGFGRGGIAGAGIAGGLLLSGLYSQTSDPIHPDGLIPGKRYLALMTGIRDGVPLLASLPPMCENPTTGDKYGALVAGLTSGVAGLAAGIRKCDPDGHLENGKRYLALVQGVREGVPILVAPCAQCATDGIYCATCSAYWRETISGTVSGSSIHDGTRSMTFGAPANPLVSSGWFTSWPRGWYSTFTHDMDCTSGGITVKFYSAFFLRCEEGTQLTYGICQVAYSSSFLLPWIGRSYFGNTFSVETGEACVDFDCDPLYIEGLLNGTGLAPGSLQIDCAVPFPNTQTPATCPGGVTSGPSMLITE